MIAHLKGVVESVGENWMVIDVHGVGYLVSCSSRTLSDLSVGEAASVHVITQMREDSLQLFGFADAVERDWFQLLMTVQGVGGKVALAILSALPTDDLARAIAMEDKTGLTRAPGVGPKLAARLLTELKDKAPTMPVREGVKASAPITLGAAAEAVSALINLGYRPMEAEAAVGRAAKLLGEGAPTSGLVRAGLKELGRERAS